MSIEKISEEIKKFLNSLQKTVQYETSQYTGFKVNKKMYADFQERKNDIRISISKKYVTEEELKSLNIEIKPESFGWALDAEMKIDDSESLDMYKEILKRAYEGTKQEYELKVKLAINKAI